MGEGTVPEIGGDRTGRDAEGKGDASVQVILILIPKLLDFHLLGKQQIMPLRWLFQILDMEQELQRKWAWISKTWVLQMFV